MEELPKLLETELLASEEVEVSDWVQKALDSAQKFEVFPYEKELAQKLIQKAFYFVENKGYASGIVLAAAFDVFVAAQYYRSVVHIKDGITVLKTALLYFILLQTPVQDVFL